jgi:hypothetical protein
VFHRLVLAKRKRPPKWAAARLCNGVAVRETLASGHPDGRIGHPLYAVEIGLQQALGDPLHGADQAMKVLSMVVLSAITAMVAKTSMAKVRIV